MKVPIIYQDDHVVVINKPSGLLVHRSAIDKQAVHVAMTILRNQLNRWVYPVHRLDRPTSGILLFAFNSEIARDLSLQFSEKSVEKTYLAVVRGYTEEVGIIDYPLKDKRDRIADRKSTPTGERKEAVTRYQRLGQIEIPVAVSIHPTTRYSLISLNPETGRRNQIRRHLHHIFHPIIGDTKYGDGRHNRYFRDQFDLKSLMLTAVQLKFTHPATKERIELNASLEADFLKIVEQFGWKKTLNDQWFEQNG